MRRPVSNDPARKHFITKWLGLMAVVSLAPKLLAGSVRAVAAPAGSASRSPLRSEPRAVARRADSL